MFFLDADPAILEDRITEREEREMFETLEKLRKVRKKSLELVRNWNIIDTSGSIEETFFKINEILNSFN